MKIVWLVLVCCLLAACGRPAVPEYPNIESTIALDSDPSLRSLVAAFWTTDSAAEVEAWYREDMPKAGWVYSSSRDRFFGFAAKNNPDVGMTIMIEEQGLTLVLIGEQVSVTYSGPPPASASRRVSPTQDPDAPAASAYTKRWLQKLPCAAPCWEGVTPGNTVTEAIAILKHTPGIVARSVQTSLWPEANTGYITWKWDGSDHGGEALYDLNADPQVVAVIRPTFGSIPHADASFRFAEVIAAYGAPSHIWAEAFYGQHGDGPFYVIKIFYVQNGLRIEQRGLNWQKPVLDDHIIFNDAMFEALPMPIDPARMVAWEGFKDFDFYCRSGCEK